MMKHPMTKYLMCSAVGALALMPFAAQAQEMTSTTTTVTTTTTTPGYAVEPVLVTGTVLRYYSDQSGYVTAADVQTADGVKMVHFPANRASYLYTNAPVGGNVNVWVTPSANDASYWNVVGYGANRPGYWWNTVATSDIDWLRAEPFVNIGAKETKVKGNLKGVVTDDNGEVLALAIDTAMGWALVRVPPELRQIAPDHRGTERVTPLMKNASVEVVGLPEAPRVGGLSGYNWTIAANTIRVNGDTVGAIGLPAIKMARKDSLLSWDIGGGINDNMSADEVRAYNMGYYNYVPVTTTMTTTTQGAMAPMNTGMTTTTTTTSELATGRVMIVAADGTMMPVVQKDGKLWVQAADGTLTRLKKDDGKYVVPASMTGARMTMVMADGRQMNMDTVNGQLMVIMADGSMAPVTLHTP